MDKRHPDGHTPPLEQERTPRTPVAIPAWSQRPRVTGRGGFARPLEQLCALAAPIPHLGLYWREGGTLLAVLHLSGNRIG